MNRRIIVLGEHDPTWETHRATDAAIEHSARFLGVSLHVEWRATESISSTEMENADGFWIATGAPYRSQSTALKVIRYAREQNVPCLGTCQGFQHLMMEFAQAFLGLVEPGHAEYDRGLVKPFIAPLSCSLRGQEAEIRLVEGSLAAKAYGNVRALERFYCSFGIHPDFVASVIASDRIKVSGLGPHDEIRVVEYPGHPFMVGTLFVPQVRSLSDRPHPLITAFLGAVRASKSE